MTSPCMWVKALIPCVLVFCMVGPCFGTFYCPDYCQCFSNKRSYRYVTCVNQGLYSVDLDIPQRVQWLQLSYNFIATLDDYAFKNLGLKQLVELNLDHNGIRSIGLRAFDGLRYLEVVDLSMNHLKNILPFTFAENAALKQLYLGGNPLGMLKDKEPFLAAASLEVLDLSDCRLGFIPAYSFGLVPNLQHLNISHNHLLTIDERSIESLHSLASIDISGNKIICDSHIATIDKWLREDSIVLIGTPCPQPNPNLELVEAEPEAGPKKSESIVLELPSAEEKSEEIDELQEFSEEEELEEKEVEGGEMGRGMDCHCVETVKTCDSCLRLNVPLLIVLASSAGFFVGSVIVIMAMYVREKCKSTRYLTYRAGLCRTPIEAPPPPYEVVVRWNDY